MKNVTTLTRREAEIYQLFCQGLSVEEISKQEGITKNTVNTFRQSIIEKKNCHSLREVLALRIKELETEREKK
jgi:DNA-binding CsgD family transcriptional regulator